MGSALAVAPLLSRLPADVRARLEADATPVEVAAGELLFAAGDPADTVYVVTAGLLDVEQGGTVIRQVGAGAVLGELALLAGGTRSASVRARRDSHLLGVTHEAFERVVATDVLALRALTEVLAAQLQDAAPAAPGRPPRPRVIVVAALHAGAPADGVADALVAHLTPTLRVARPGRVGPDGLQRAERDSDRVLLVAADPADDWWAQCVRQADLLVLVAASDSAVPQVPAARPHRIGPRSRRPGRLG